MPETMREAIQKRSSFNVIHLQTMLKVDMLFSRNRRFSRNRDRAQGKSKIDEETGRDLFVASAEDTILTEASLV